MAKKRHVKISKTVKFAKIWIYFQKLKFCMFSYKIPILEKSYQSTQVCFKLHHFTSFDMFFTAIIMVIILLSLWNYIIKANSAPFLRRKRKKQFNIDCICTQKGFQVSIFFGKLPKYRVKYYRLKDYWLWKMNGRRMKFLLAKFKR